MAGKPPICAARADTEKAESRDARENGTGFANYSNTRSCHLAQLSHGQPLGWGGARNRADRVSDGLTPKQAIELLEAVKYALDTGRIFQRHWTIHYGLAGIAPGDGARFVSRILDFVSKQARRDGGELTAIWVRECASGKGEHLHILLCLPAKTTLRNRTRRWIEAAGGKVGKGVSKVTIIAGRLPRNGKVAARAYRDNAENVLHYLLKGADSETGKRLGLTRWGRCGQIMGKRCGTTVNLGRAARNGDGAGREKLTK